MTRIKIYHNLILVLLLSIVKCVGQTNVSGGIFSNTTWTLANSPYILTDTVVVFPGVTLTIDPGVTIKFDNDQFLEIRQSRLIANGTTTDPITFTSNSISPFPGIYRGLLADAGYGSQIRYCKFEYANNIFGGDTMSNCVAMFNVNGLRSLNLLDSCIIRYSTGTGAISGDITNCIISNNYIGAEPGFNLINCTIDSSVTIGVRYNGGGSGIISNCTIRYDSVGIEYGNYNLNNCIITHHKFGIIITTNHNISNSIIDSNFIGILNGRYAFMGNLAGTGGQISNCEINYNSIGIYSNIESSSIGGLYTISNCQINYNGIGISDFIANGRGNMITANVIEYDSVGIFLSGYADSIYCNSICINISYGLKYHGSNNLNASHNYWCTSDSASTENLIYDGYDDVSYGLVSFMPIDSACTILTSIDEVENIEKIIYPNPASDYLTIDTQFKKVRIFNLVGEENKFCNLSNGRLDISKIADGLYLLEMNNGKRIVMRKFIKKSTIQ
jgi:hypothetical protein